MWPGDTGTTTEKVGGSFARGCTIFSAVSVVDDGSTDIRETAEELAEANGTETSSSADEEECGSNLGASDCAADDGQCLVEQCEADAACQASGIDCSTYG